MFSVEEMSTILESAWFLTGRRELERDILRSRLGLDLVSTRGEDQLHSLRRFTGAVLASLSKWENPRDGIARQLCLSAADIEAALALLHLDDLSSMSHRRHVLRSAVLYDVAGMPGVAATLAQRDGLATDAKDFFSRGGKWGRLSSAEPRGTNLDSTSLEHPADGDELVNAALGDVLGVYSTILQNPTEEPALARSDLRLLDSVVGRYSSFLSRDECSALRRSLELRSQNATLRLAKTYSSLQEPALRNLQLPAEMWPVQRRAMEEGLLSPEILSFGLAAPTGTGKTALMRLLIADFLEKNPGKKAVYVSPSRALSAQVAHDLSEALSRVNKKVLALGAHLSLHPVENLDPETADVLVFTPEKADLIMRIMPESLAQVGLVIVDEAHHIEQGTRGILLEFYLWRLRSLVPSDSRFVQLSAVAPNIKDMVGWLGGKEQSSRSLTLDWRTSRLRMGIFERRTDGSAIVQFGTEAPYVLLQRGECPSDPIENLAMLANRLAQRGIVLVLTTSPSAAEKIAEEVSKLREPSSAQLGDTGDRLDARIERELYPDAPLREQLRKRVVYHHAQLPPRVRLSIEHCVADRQVDVVCATTTLGEGVNFPFSTVIVDSLVGRGYQLSPRSLWNIAGRAGRFGVDSEGHCILFRPSRWKAKLSEYSLEDYLRTNLADIPPVRSALANAITDLKQMVDEGSVDFEQLSNISLGEIQKKGHSSRVSIGPVRGLLNVMRVGYAHASTSKTISVETDTAPEFDSDLLASRQMSGEEKSFAQKLGRQQRRVIRDALREDADLVTIAARIGWALETQQNLYEWLKGLEDWRLTQFGEMVLGGKIMHPERLGYLLGPLSKHMSEFEGESLGGYTSYIAVNWLRGLPLTEIQKAQQKMDFGRLVRVIYSRIQYMLPWALFGVHELMGYEAKRRRIKVGDGVRDLSVLAAEGVPDFDALTLVMRLDIERVDAARLAASYQRGRPETDVVGWLRGLQWERVAAIVRGQDNRRLDPDLRRLWETLSK
jgi:superfamily II DNA/RNA helicase